MKKRVWIFFYVTVNLQRYISELSGSFRAFRRWGRSTFHWIVPACYRARFSLIVHACGDKPMRAFSEICHHSKRDERGTVGKENPGFLFGKTGDWWEETKKQLLWLSLVKQSFSYSISQSQLKLLNAIYDADRHCCLKFCFAPFFF